MVSATDRSGGHADRAGRVVRVRSPATDDPIWHQSPRLGEASGRRGVHGYLGETFARPPAHPPTWFRDDPFTEIDLWATPDESSEYIVRVYTEAAAHADDTIRQLDLDSAGQVPHWSDDQQTTLGSMLVLMVAETAQHAGHADILKELITAAGPGDARWSGDRFSQAQAAADWFR